MAAETRRATSDGRTLERDEQEACPGKLWVAFGMEQYVRRMWEHFTVKKAWARSVILVESGKKKGKKEYKAIGKRSRHTRRS